jgi:hypothetical protein
MAIKTFTTGEVLTASDTNTYLANSGLVYVKEQTVGNAVASVTITNAFSTTFDDYRIIYVGGSSSASNDLAVTLGTTTAGYYFGSMYVSFNGVFNSIGVNNGASWTYAGCQDTPNHLDCDIFSPFIARTSTISCAYVGTTTGRVIARGAGLLNNTTSYTDLKISAGSGTITGGIVYVYGYRKA